MYINSIIVYSIIKLYEIIKNNKKDSYEIYNLIHKLINKK